MINPTRPEIVNDEHLEFLDDLRESAATNMFGASTYVKDEFDCTKKEAREIVGYWMETFGNENR